MLSFNNVLQFLHRFVHWGNVLGGNLIFLSTKVVDLYKWLRKVYFHDDKQEQGILEITII